MNRKPNQRPPDIIKIMIENGDGTQHHGTYYVQGDYIHVDYTGWSEKARKSQSGNHEALARVVLSELVKKHPAGE